MGEGGPRLQAEEQEQVGVSFQCFPMLVVYDDIVCDIICQDHFSRDPYYQWEVAGIVPCRSHTVRLYLGENFIEVRIRFKFFG